MLLLHGWADFFAHGPHGKSLQFLEDCIKQQAADKDTNWKGNVEGKHLGENVQIPIRITSVSM